MSKKRLLVISYSFPPLNKVGSMRFGELIPFLEEEGWECWVITSKSIGDLKVNLPEERIFRIGNYNKELVLNLNSLIKGDFNLYEVIRKFLDRKLGFKSFTVKNISWVIGVLKSRKEIKKKLPQIDLVLATYNPIDDLWLGRYFGKLYNVKSIADFRDLAALLPGKKNSFVSKMDISIERFLLKDYSAITTVSNTLNDILKNEYNKPVYTVYNGWDTQKNGINVDDRKYLYYAGAFYKHRIRSIYLLLEALTDFPEFKLIIRSLGPEYINQKIILKAKELKIESQVEILESTKLKIVEEEMLFSMVNIVFEDLSTEFEASKGNLTGKFLKLLAMPPAILSIARDDNEMGQILSETQKGMLCSSTEEIKSFLTILKENKKAFYGNNSLIDIYSKKRQANYLSRILKMFVEN